MLSHVIPGCSTPRPGDQLWIVTDGAVQKPGIGATLYVTRDGKLRLAGFFSAKLRGSQSMWLLCEVMNTYQSHRIAKIKLSSMIIISDK